MAKRQTLLFELMKDTDSPQAPKGFWGQFFRKTGSVKPAATEQASLPFDDNKAETAVAAAGESPKAESSVEPAVGDGSEAQLYLRLNTFTKIFGAALILVIFFCGYILGRQLGYRAGIGGRSDAQLNPIKASLPEEDVLEVKEKPAPIKTEFGKGAVEPEKNTEIPKNVSKNTRKNGYNYLIIQVFDAKVDAEQAKTDADRAKAFLAEKGIEATVELYQSADGRSKKYLLVSVNGYANLKESQEDKKEATAFLRQIQAYGQQYRKLKDSHGYDFQSFYARWPLKK